MFGRKTLTATWLLLVQERVRQRRQLFHLRQVVAMQRLQTLLIQQDQLRRKLVLELAVSQQRFRWWSQVRNQQWFRLPLQNPRQFP